MEVFKYIFIVLVIYLIVTLSIRLYWYFKDGYFQLSWIAEWFIAAISCVGIFVVAYNVPILNQGFWWFVLFLILLSTVLRLRSETTSQQLHQLSKGQLLFVYSLMVLFTAPIAIGLFINAANLSNILVGS